MPQSIVSLPLEIVSLPLPSRMAAIAVTFEVMNWMLKRLVRIPRIICPR